MISIDCFKYPKYPQQPFILCLMSPNAGTVESRPSSPLFVPAKPEKKKKKSVRRTRRRIKEGGDGSTDSDDLVAEGGIEEATKKKRRRGPADRKGSGGKAAGNQRDGEGSEVTGRSSGRAERDDSPLSAGREHGKTGDVEERPRSNKTSNAPGEHCSSCCFVFKNVFIEEDKNLPLLRVKLPPTHLHVVFPFNIPFLEDSSQEEKAPTRQTGEKQKALASNGKNRDGERLKDFYEECVRVSAALERGPNTHNWLKANSE